MHAAFMLLDQAIELGRQELAHLAAGDLDKAEAVASGREGVIDKALADKGLAESRDENLDGLLARLNELKELQARIIDEASRLKREVGDELRRAGQEQKRHAGYGRAARPTPRIQSRFISQNS